MQSPTAGSYSGIPRAISYGSSAIHNNNSSSSHSAVKNSNSSSSLPRAASSNKILTKRASVVNFQRPQPMVPANTVTPPLTPQTSDENLYMIMSPKLAHQEQLLQSDGQRQGDRVQERQFQQYHQQHQQQQHHHHHQQPQNSHEHAQLTEREQPYEQMREQTRLQQPQPAQQQQPQQHHEQQVQQQQQQQQQVRQQQLQQEQLMPQSPQPAPFTEYWRAFYGYYPAYDAQSSTVTLPLNAGDLVLVHSIHDNGWADGTLLSSGIRGWFPTNYCEPYDPDAIRNLLRALTTFFDIVRSGAEGNVAVFCNQDYLRGLVAGVRSLLEKTACLSREAPLVSACLALSRTRKALLSDLSTLVKIAKGLQSELTATHAQPELDEACIDDMVLRAFKLVMRAVKFHDTWIQTVMDEEGVDGPDSPGLALSATYPNVDGTSNTTNFPLDSPVNATFQHLGSAPLTGVSIDSNGVDAVTRSLDTAIAAITREADMAAPGSTSNNVTSVSTSSSSVVPAQQQSPLQYHYRLSRPATSVLYSPTQAAHLQAQLSMGSNSRPTSLAAPSQAAGNRHSISHRISYASRLDGVAQENLASEHLTQAHENLLTGLGAFIGLHVSSRTSQELLSTTQECLDSTECLTQTMRTIWERGYYGSESIDEIEEIMFGNISTLVDAVQGIFNALNQAEDDGVMDLEYPACDRRQLTEAATHCIRAAGESVAKGRYVLEMIGDFEFDHDSPSSPSARQPSFEATSLATQNIAENEEEDSAAQAGYTAAAATDAQRPLSSTYRPLSSQRLSAIAPPQPMFEPPAVPNASLRLDTQRVSADQGDMPPLSERMSNGSWLPPLPRFANANAVQDSQMGYNHGHSFLTVADGQDVQVSPRSDSLHGTSLISGSTKRNSEQSSVSVTSTRATSPEHAGETGSPSKEQADTEDDEELEQNVLEKTYAHELVFRHGRITAGTLPALVERLTTADSTPDATFVSTFFLTFRLFATPEEFAQALIDRFVYSNEGRIGASPIQLRVYNVFKQWLESHWQHDADEAALGHILIFCDGSLVQVLPNAGRHLRDLATKARKSTLKPVSSFGKGGITHPAVLAPHAPTPNPNISKSQINMLKAWRDGKAMPSIVDFEPLEIARQITLKVSALFCKIMPQELLGVEWTKKNGSVAVNVRALSTLSTDLANLVADTTLSQEDAGKRGRIVKHWIKIAKCCFDMANYDSLIAIICSLNSTTILRLKKTWDTVSAKTKAVFENLKTAVAVSKNFKSLRLLLADAVPPCIPFLGMYLTDLTFVDAGNPKTRTTSDGVVLINFHKHSLAAQTIRELQHFQVPYRLQDIPELQTWLTNSFARMRAFEESEISSNAFYRRSLALEPRVDNRMQAMPSPALAQGGNSSPTEERPKGGMKDFQNILRGVMKRENSNFETGRRPSITLE